jgi:LCP family protein required for cell wall assembly
VPEVFDHLDDPHPFTPDDGLRERVRRRGRSLRRRRSAAVAAGCLAVGLLAGVAGASTLVERNLDDVQRVDVAGVGDGALDDVEVAPIDGVRTLLLTGIDTDDGLEPDDPALDRARPESARSDTIVLARVDPDAGELRILPLPRDLWVDLPGHGPGRINQALPLGGPDLLVATIESSLGIEVDHYLQTDFAGAIEIGEVLGGVRVAPASPLRDRQTGLELDAGCQVVRGPQLLALGRARHLEQLIDGQWVADPTSDLGRIERQQALAAGVLAQLVDLGADDPIELYRLTEAAARHLTVDASLGDAELLGLVASLQGLEVVPLRIDVVDAMVGGAAVLERVPGERGIDDFLGRPRPAGRGGAGGLPRFAVEAVVPAIC